MQLTALFTTAIRGLKSNKSRSALTILGIVIGITSVVVMMSVGQGAQDLIVGQIVSTGANTIFVEPGSWDPKNSSMMQSKMEEFDVKTLKYEDALAIAKDPTIDLVSPAVVGVARAVYQNKDKKITFMGITPEAFEINGTQVASGRALTKSDVKNMARVVVLGYKVKQNLFGDQEAVGKTIRIKKTNFKVVGVAEKQGMQMFQNLDENVYLPLTTAQKLLLGIDYVRWIVARAVDKSVIDQAVENIRLILRERHNIYNPENDLSKDDFKVMSQVEAASMLTTVTGVFTIFLSSVAAIALIVGGIGIMNIMLVSVTERTREVGLRKAIGASKKDILWQFLVEAVVLTVVGGVIGIILGVFFSYIASMVLSKVLGREWVFAISLDAVLLGFSVAAVVGVIFGIYPAKKAANLEPVEALRYE